MRGLPEPASHPINHLFPVAMIYKIQAGKTPEEFGVAPSTLKVEGGLFRGDGRPTTERGGGGGKGEAMGGARP